MTRYFFDYRSSDGVVTPDDIGEELDTLDEARALALAAVGDAAVEMTREGRELHLTINIRDGVRVVAGATVIVSTK